MFNRRGMLNNYSTISAYVFGGIGLTKYWTTLEREPRLTDTYDDRNKFIPSFPLGVGLKYIISDKWMIGYEIGGRYTLSDYLDGFKPRASKHNDIYWISALNINYRIKTSRRGLPLFLDRYRVRIRTRRRWWFSTKSLLKELNFFYDFLGKILILRAKNILFSLF